MLEKDSKVKIQFKLLTFFVCVCSSPAAELWLLVAIDTRMVNKLHYCNRANCSKSKGVAAHIAVLRFHIADIAHHISALRFQVELKEFLKLLLVGLLVKLLLVTLSPYNYRKSNQSFFLLHLDRQTNKYYYFLF